MTSPGAACMFHGAYPKGHLACLKVAKFLWNVVLQMCLACGHMRSDSGWLVQLSHPAFGKQEHSCIPAGLPMLGVFSCPQ